jgi:hypothetical protein
VPADGARKLKHTLPYPFISDVELWRSLGAYNSRMGVPEFIVVAALVMLLIGGHQIGKLGQGLSEGIQNFKDALGGGPRPPTHPLPGDDSVIVNRRRSRGWPEL